MDPVEGRGEGFTEMPAGPELGAPPLWTKALAKLKEPKLIGEVDGVADAVALRIVLAPASVATPVGVASVLLWNFLEALSKKTFGPRIRYPNKI